MVVWRAQRGVAELTTMGPGAIQVHVRKYVCNQSHLQSVYFSAYAVLFNFFPLFISSSSYFFPYSDKDCTADTRDGAIHGMLSKFARRRTGYLQSPSSNGPQITDFKKNSMLYAMHNNRQATGIAGHRARGSDIARSAPATIASQGNQARTSVIRQC